MTSKTEAAVIRSQLALRINPNSGCYEVYTTIHGSSLFKWYAIGKNTAKWYAQQFNLVMPIDPILNEANHEQ